MKRELITLKPEELNNLGLGELYEYIAIEKLGIDKKAIELAKFDCRHIKYGYEIDETLKGNYKRIGLSDEELTIRFVWFAPKVDKSLKGNQVLVEDGFLVFND